MYRGEQESAIVHYIYCHFLYFVKIIVLKLKQSVTLREIYSPSRGEDKKKKKKICQRNTSIAANHKIGFTWRRQTIKKIEAVEQLIRKV